MAIPNSDSAPPFVGAVEAGGTKFVLGCGTGHGDVRDVVRLPTGLPDKTLAQCVDYFRAMERKHGKLGAIGIGTFGPAGVNPSEANWGKITTTPKLPWQHCDMAGVFRSAFGVPVGFDTDVNAAGLGEWLWGAGRGCDAVLYLTIGTGIGGGYILDGRPLHGLLHPEMGHVRVPRHPADNFAGHCPWHADCLEGMASGEAMKARWGRPAGELPADHPAWEMEATYLAEACAGYSCTLSPQRVILGGGVMEQPGLLAMVQQKTRRVLNGYLAHPRIIEDVDQYLTAPALGPLAGLLGAMVLARRTLSC